MAGTRNNAVGAIVMLIGAGLIGFGATQPWGVISINLFGSLEGLAPNGEFGFDGDSRVMVVGLAVLIALSSGALLITRVKGLGVVWRLMGILAAAAVALLCGYIWTFLNDPSAVSQDAGSMGGELLGRSIQVLERIGLGALEPGIGLWLVTLGVGVALIGGLIPAIRHPEMPRSASTSGVHFAPTAGLAAGWYPNQADETTLRWFDGMQWTHHTRPRV